MWRRDLYRLDDVKVFLHEARTLCGNGEAFIHFIMSRHADIQRGKFDMGRRKMPWLEYVSRGRVTEAAPDKETTYKPTLPYSFGEFDFTSLGATVSAQAVDPVVLKEEVGMEGFIGRPVSAKWKKG